MCRRAAGRCSHPGRIVWKAAPTTSAVVTTSSRSTNPKRTTPIHGLVRWERMAIRARGGVHHAGTRAPPSTRVSVLAHTHGRIHADGRRAHRTNRRSERRQRGLPVRQRCTSLSHVRKRCRRPHAVGAGTHRVAERFAGFLEMPPVWTERTTTSARHDESAAPSSTTASPILTATTTASHGSSCEHHTATTPSISGSTEAIPTSCCSPAIRCPISRAARSRWNR